MDYLGLYALGCFVGGLSMQGLHYITSLEAFEKALVIIFGAAFTGAVGLILGRFLSLEKAVGAYTVGLAVSLLWTFIPEALSHLPSHDPIVHNTGVAELSGIVSVTFLMTIIFLIPAVREAWSKAHHRAG